MMDPPRLLDGILGATERRLLEAARQEEPDEVLAQKMLAPLGLVVPPTIYSGSEMVEGAGQTFVPQGTTGQAVASTGSAAGASLPPVAPLLLGGATKWVGSALLIGVFGGASLWGASRLLTGGDRAAGASPAPLGTALAPGFEDAGAEGTALRQGAPVSGKASPGTETEGALPKQVTGEPVKGAGAFTDRDSTQAGSGEHTSTDPVSPEPGPSVARPGQRVSTGTRAATSPRASSDQEIQGERSPEEETFESSVIAEIGILGEVRLQLHEGNPGRALGLLADYRRQFPTGKLVPEARLLEARARQQLAQTRQVGDQPSP